MDRATQEAAVDKLNHTLRMVGYPEEFVRNSTLLDKLYEKIQVKPAFSDTLHTIDQSKSWINLQKLSLTNTRDNPFDPTDLTSANAAMEADRNYKDSSETSIFRHTAQHRSKQQLDQPAKTLADQRP
ncbi:uncharacterized protein LOC129591071 [Paramacrobiotus metropolitanus]|uniref:uncharacterized protein LOC129591071 n=1 Tax=Paramacrobiotus metropolitanus TaxID=2943436 RepID=UPI00244607BF|nr:uncharacterized protein LOC129591071 [Paramacrobiotus metropolitanus]